MITKRTTMLASVSVVTIAAAFEGGQAGWAMDGETVKLTNGNPTYVREDGTEMIIEPTTIGRLNNEAKSHRERAERAEGSLKAFEGLDAAAARDALDKIGKIDAKKLIDAGEVDRVREEVGKGYQSQIGERDKTIETLTGELHGLKKTTAFSTSEYIDKNVAMPREILRSHFDNNFRFEDGKMVPYDAHGNKLFSKTRMGEVANFDEAIAQLIEQSPYKDHILKAPEQRGTGNHGGGGNRGGGAVMARAAFDALSPADKAAAGERVRKGELQIAN